MTQQSQIRHDWQLNELQAIYQQPFMDLLLQAQQVHREHFTANRIQTSTLLSIKTGACPEDCAYCPQSGHYNTGLSKEQLMQVEQVVAEAKAARETGATRFCMGAAWRSPRDKDMPAVLEMVKQVKSLGLETCMTLGMLNEQQANALAEAGLDYYNHNLDTSETYYDSIITTRTFGDRLKTLEHVRNAKINVCSGGILGLGETEQDRLGLIQALANMPEHPQSVPINQLVAVPGTPLEDAEPCEELDFIRMIALARIVLPRSYVRLSAGRETMTDSMQALCFMAGANSIFYGEKLLTTENPELMRDQQLLADLGIEQETIAGDSLHPMAVSEPPQPLYYQA